jgi:hypothetical protein
MSFVYETKSTVYDNRFAYMDCGILCSFIQLTSAWMTVTEFILSGKRSRRFIRHFTFWVSFAILYYCQSLVPWDNLFYVALISLLCYFPAVIISQLTFWS